MSRKENEEKEKGGGERRRRRKEGREGDKLEGRKNPGQL